MDELEKTIKWLENSRGGNKTIRAAVAEIRRLQAIEAAGRELLEALRRITDGATAVYEAGEKHGMSARAEIDHRDLTFAKKVIRKAAALEAKP